MAHSFKPGDRAVLIRALRPDNIGRVTTVLSTLGPFRPKPGWAERAVLPPGTPVHTIDAPSFTGSATSSAPPEWLVPYTPDHADPIAWTEELRLLCGLKDKVNS